MPWYSLGVWGTLHLAGEGVCGAADPSLLFGCSRRYCVPVLCLADSPSLSSGFEEALFCDVVFASLLLVSRSGLFAWRSLSLLRQKENSESSPSCCPWVRRSQPVWTIFSPAFRVSFVYHVISRILIVYSGRNRDMQACSYFLKVSLF